MHINTATAKKIWEFAHPYRKAALLSTIFVSLVVMINLVPPLLYRLLIDDGIKNGNRHLMALYAGCIMLAVVASSVMQMLEEYFSCQFGLVMMNDVRNRLYRHLQTLPVRFFLATNGGAIINRFTLDLLNVQRVVARTLPSVITNILMIAFSLALMFYLNWKLTLIAVVAIPLYAVFAIHVSKIVAAMSARAMHSGDRMVSRLSEDFGIEGLIFFKLFGIQEARRTAFESLTGEIQQIRLRLGLWGRANTVAIDLMQSLGVIAIYYVGGLTFIDGDITLGTIIAFATLTGRLYQPIAFFSSSVIDLPTALLSLDRINAFLKEPAQLDNCMALSGHAAALAQRLPSPSNRHSVIFDNVSFQYPGSRRETGIHRVSFAIKMGERVSIVGANGSGKTTLMMLMAGIYRPDQGEIYIAGIKISALAQSEIAALLSVGLGQGFFLSASIKDNLLIVKPDAGEAEMRAVLRRADCDAFIDRLPDGIDTQLGQSGLQLSSGQRQRLSLARLFLKNCDVLCFDESTANIDAESEDVIIDAINHSPAHQTAIVISHSLKAIRHAKRILVIDQGKLVGDGSHPALSENCPEYRRLFGAAPSLLKHEERVA